MTTHIKQQCTLGIVIAAALVAFVTLAGCGEKRATLEPVDSTVPPEQETVVDDAVDQMTLPIEIRLALLDEFGVDGLRIETVVENGYVTLAGTVHDPSSQLSAETIVSEIDGVDEVVNTIVVAPSEDLGSEEADTSEQLKLELADELLEAEIKLRLFASIGANAARIDVESVNGTVSLSGAVEEAQEKTGAVAAAEEALGVVEVIDLIQVADPILVEEMQEEEH